jgi:hypothetical protein
VLPVFAFLFFIFLAFLALVADLGLAHVTQLQLQTASDTASLEGARLGGPAAAALVATTDADGQPVLTAGPEFNVAKSGTNDLQVTIGGPPYPPLPVSLELTAEHGTAGYYASTSLVQAIDTAATTLIVASAQGFQQVSVPFTALIAYDLADQTTLQQGGEIVTVQQQSSTTWTVARGTEGTATRPHSIGARVTLIPDQPVEADDNSRKDFVSNSAGDAFLVRVRRDDVDDAGGEHAALPLLFGRGAMLPFDHPLRTRGIPIRGVAIAAGRPAKAVGTAYAAGAFGPSLAIRGSTPFVLTRDYWSGLASNVPSNPINSDANGGLFVTGPGGTTVVGQIVTPPPGTLIAIGQNVQLNKPVYRRDPNGPNNVVQQSRINMSIAAVGPLSQPSASIDQFYVPLSDAVPNDLNDQSRSPHDDPNVTRVVGFGICTWILNADGSLTVTPLPSSVARENATPSLAPLLLLEDVSYAVSLSDQELATLLSFHRLVREPLQAAALVR